MCNAYLYYNVPNIITPVVTRTIFKTYNVMSLELLKGLCDGFQEHLFEQPKYMLWPIFVTNVYIITLKLLASDSGCRWRGWKRIASSNNRYFMTVICFLFAN